MGDLYFIKTLMLCDSERAHSNETFALSAAKREDAPRLEHELRKANVVIIVYSIDDPQSVRPPGTLGLSLAADAMNVPETDPGARSDTQFERISMYWMPRLRSLGISLPVVLVGNKSDTRKENAASAQTLEEGVLEVDSLDLPTDRRGLTSRVVFPSPEVFPLMQTWKEIETCVECSAKSEGPLEFRRSSRDLRGPPAHSTSPLFPSLGQHS